MHRSFSKLTLISRDLVEKSLLRLCDIENPNFGVPVQSLSLNTLEIGPAFFNIFDLGSSCFPFPLDFCNSDVKERFFFFCGDVIFRILL